ncbi:hypothetical protein EKG39_07700 [Shewanella atlantica]|uniref:Uncharacterized protein n=2 Tax=Shewanella atlantica TaxID=271099 RepID=A0A3S0IXK1_9GAMM|nr:hypothetical protein EKG39_07700 [Shewanella atlantica]
MKMRRELYSALLLSLLAGCGSDDTASSPVTPDTPEPEKSKYLTLYIKPDTKFTGEFYINLGRYDDPVTHWIHDNSDLNNKDKPKADGPDVDYNKDGWIDERDAHLAGIYNPKEPIIKVDAIKMHQLLMTNPDGLGAGTARPDIFVPGQYGVFDALRYLAVTRNDLKIENIVTPENSGRDTFEFEISWDSNGDGLFDEMDNDIYANYQGKDWHFRSRYDGGEFKKIDSTISGIGPQGELTYSRMDQMWIQPGMTIRFQPFSPEMTQRRHWVQNREMARIAEAGGKVIVPTIAIDYKKKDVPPTIIKNLEVTAHNMRPDIFQPGVITKMDVYLSAADAGQDIAFNYWPTLSTGAKIEHFALFRINGVSSDVGRGWTTGYGEMAMLKDFTRNSQCDFSSPAGGGLDIEVDPEHCRIDWRTNFGGWAVHIMSDVWVMNQPVEYVYAEIKSHYKVWGMPEFSGKDVMDRDFSQDEDGSDIMTLQVFELPDGSGSASDKAILKPDHFGWGIADCTECHNAEKAPLGHGGYSWPINSSDGFDETQPYYCATCHGNNGAPSGHGETARCFWCHDTKENRPLHHGDASTQRRYQDSKGEIKSNTHIYNTNAPKDLNSLPRDSMGNYEEYTDLMSSRNSDWDMSRVFPDPYSCMTCHPNPN